MQVFATLKAIASCRALPKLTMLLTKYRYAVKVMKLTAIILLVGCLQISARGLSQNITLSLKDVPLQKVFKEIERQTDYTFFTDKQWLQKAKKVTIVASGLPLNQVLELCFRDQPFSYSISGKTITLGPKKEKVEKEQKTSATQNPPVDVKGRVVDSKGNPVQNATVSVQGRNKTTITNANGEFSLVDIDEDAVIVVSHVQFETENITLNGRSIVNATLQVKIGSLDELQVIAYGTTTKRLNTGNVTSVKAEDIQKQPVQNVLLALEGRVPGLFITQNTGLPGAGVTVRVQGLNSISSGNDPLYIIDGVPYSSQLLPTVNSIQGNSGVAGVGGNPLSFINPASIESIDILKDADATAIYGSRAANGAILITTKKGKSGAIKTDVTIMTGWGKVSRKLELMNSDQYLEMRKQAYRNDGLPIPTVRNASNFDLTTWDSNKNTDWQEKLIGGTAIFNNAQLTFSGGSSNTQYIIGAAYNRETTVFPGRFSDIKGSLNFNLNNTSNNQKFRIQLGGNYMFDNNKLPGIDLTTLAISLAPNAPDLYNSDGTLNWQRIPGSTDSISTWNNPIAFTEQRFKAVTHNLITNSVLSYQVLPYMLIKSNFGYTNIQTNEIYSIPLSAQRPENRSPNLRRSNFGSNNNLSWIIEPQVVLNAVIGKGKFETLFGGTFQENLSRRQQVNALGFNSDQSMEDMSSAFSIAPAGSVISTYRYNAIFGRVNYNWSEKYIVNLTARRDGSTRFGSKNKFHDFWSVSGGWIFSNEALIKRNVSAISFGKVWASYGTTGNDQIGDYKYLSLYSTVDDIGNPYQGATGLQPTGLNNPYLQWEETKKFNFGMTLGFIKDRILLNVNYFRNRSSNQLESYSLPIQTGFYDITRNFPAIVQNTGFELSLATTIFTSNRVSWTSNINVTLPKNKLISFPNLETSSQANSLVIGKSINILKAYHYLGVDPSTGLYQFLNFNGNPTSSPDFLTDRNVLVDLQPELFGGIQNSVKYRKFELDFLFQFVKQVKTNYAFGNFPGSFLNVGTRGNQPVYIGEAWKKLGDAAIIQRYSSNYPSAVSKALNSVYNSDAYLNDASFLRLKNISLTWQIPDGWKGTTFKGVKLFFQAQNLLTITNYKGLDPENGSFSGGSKLPPLRVLTFGLHGTL